MCASFDARGLDTRDDVGVGSADEGSAQNVRGVPSNKHTQGIRAGSFRDTEPECTVGRDYAWDDARVVRALECSRFPSPREPNLLEVCAGGASGRQTATRSRLSGGWSPPAEQYNPVRDASRFVDDEFPRVSLAFDAAMCRVVTGLTPCTDEGTRSELHFILAILAPLVDPVQAQRTIALKRTATI